MELAIQKHAIVAALNARGIYELNELEKFTLGLRNDFVVFSNYKSGKTLSVMIHALETLVDVETPTQVVIVANNNFIADALERKFETYGFDSLVQNSFFSTSVAESKRPIVIVSPTCRGLDGKEKCKFVLFDSPDRKTMGLVVDLMLLLPKKVRVGIFGGPSYEAYDTFDLFKTVWMNTDTATVAWFEHAKKTCKYNFVEDDLEKKAQRIDFMYSVSTVAKCIIFCKTEREALRLIQYLIHLEFDPVWFLNKELDDAFRKMFINNKNRLIVTLEQFSADADFGSETTLVVNTSIPSPEFFDACHSHCWENTVTLTNKLDDLHKISHELKYSSIVPQFP
jgi:hypothetical protein